MPRENWRHIGNNIYIVRTQAGFKQAVKHFDGDDKSDVYGYPRRYPSLVALSVYYHGANDVRAQCIHVNSVLKAIKESDEELFDA